MRPPFRPLFLLFYIIFIRFSCQVLVGKPANPGTMRVSGFADFFKKIFISIYAASGRVFSNAFILETRKPLLYKAFRDCNFLLLLYYFLLTIYDKSSII